MMWLYVFIYLYMVSFVKHFKRVTLLLINLTRITEIPAADQTEIQLETIRPFAQ